MGSWEHILLESYGCGHHMELKVDICLYCCCSEKKLSFICIQWTCVHVSDGKIWGGRIFFCASHITFGRRWEQQTVILCGSLDKEPLGEDVLSLGRQTRWTLCTSKLAQSKVVSKHSICCWFVVVFFCCCSFLSRSIPYSIFFTKQIQSLQN